MTELLFPIFNEYMSTTNAAATASGARIQAFDLSVTREDASMLSLPRPLSDAVRGERPRAEEPRPLSFPLSDKGRQARRSENNFDVGEKVSAALQVRPSYQRRIGTSGRQISRDSPSFRRFMEYKAGASYVNDILPRAVRAEARDMGTSTDPEDVLPELSVDSADTSDRHSDGLEVPEGMTMQAVAEMLLEQRAENSSGAAEVSAGDAALEAEVPPERHLRAVQILMTCLLKWSAQARAASLVFTLEVWKGILASKRRRAMVVRRRLHRALLTEILNAWLRPVHQRMIQKIRFQELSRRAHLLQTVRAFNGWKIVAFRLQFARNFESKYLHKHHDLVYTFFLMWSKATFGAVYTANQLMTSSETVAGKALRMKIKFHFLTRLEFFRSWLKLSRKKKHSFLQCFFK